MTQSNDIILDTINEIINKISVQYRESLERLSCKQRQLLAIDEELFKVDLDEISHKQYTNTLNKKIMLKTEIQHLKDYTDGIFTGREVVFEYMEQHLLTKNISKKGDNNENN